VVGQFAARRRGEPDQLVERGGGLAFRAQERRARGNEFRAGPPEHGRILARENQGRSKPDRVGVELLQGHLERGALADRAG
jgi:hypothetical protein